MKKENYSSDVEYETEEKKGFQLTRGMVLLIALVLIIILIVIIVTVISSKSKSKTEEITMEDFKRLEARMIEEAPTYIVQNQIILSDEPIKIDLKSLLKENGGFIDSNRIKASKICEGYVIAVKSDVENYSSYIKCGNKYKTEGFIEDDSEKKETTKTTTTKDTTPPALILIGDSEMIINIGEKFNDPGATATDNIDGDLTSKITKTGYVNTKTEGTYIINYKVSDKAGNQSEVKRTVKVIPVSTTQVTTTVVTTTKNTNPPVTTKSSTYSKTTTKKVTTPPTITLRGNSTININVGSNYSDPGYSAVDSLGKDITAKVVVTGNVNTSKAGTYYMTYSVSDDYGNRAVANRIIVVKSTTISLTGISVSPNSLEMKPGESRTLTVYFTPTNATNKTVSWSSDEPSVASVNNGVVYAKARGIAIITVKSSNGKIDTARVIVK